MTPGDVVDTTVRLRRIVKPDPAGNMGHRRGSGPIGIILVPDHDAAVMRRLVEDLIVPEPHWSIEQLRGGNDERRIPQHIVQARCYAPGAECVKSI